MKVKPGLETGVNLGYTASRWTHDKIVMKQDHGETKSYKLKRFDNLFPPLAIAQALEWG